MTRDNECDFSLVNCEVDEMNACSPRQPDSDWTGIIINAPGKVIFKEDEISVEYGTFVVIPLCAYYRMEVSSSPDEKPKQIIAIDTDTGKSYSGLILDVEEGPVFESEEKWDPEEVKGMFVSGYFNPNLAYHVHLPRESATYEVCVEWKTYQSNKVTIQIIKEETGEHTRKD
jgi:hypothetical protein